MHKSRRMVCVIILLLFLCGVPIVSAEEKSVTSTDQTATNNTEVKPKGCAVITIKNKLGDLMERAYIRVYTMDDFHQDKDPIIIVQTNKAGVAKINGLQDGHYIIAADFKGEEVDYGFSIRNGNQKEDTVIFATPCGHRYTINYSVITLWRTTTTTKDITWEPENNQDGQPIAYIDVDGKKQLPRPIIIQQGGW